MITNTALIINRIDFKVSPFGTEFNKGNGIVDFRKPEIEFNFKKAISFMDNDVEFVFEYGRKLGRSLNLTKVEKEKWLYN